MKKSEATARINAAAAVWSKHSPGSFMLFEALLVIAWAGRCTAYLCVGVGSVSLAGASAWWGLPAALLCAETIGRVWDWRRRERLVEAFERGAALAAELAK